MTTTTSIIVLGANKQPVGALESFTIKESKTENNETVSVKLEVPRLRWVRSRLCETFERSYFHVASQIYPVDIVVLEDNKETIRITNAWLTGIHVSYTTDEWIIAEGIEFEAEHVTTTQSDQSTST